MSKPRNKRVNKKISKLVDEGYPMYQAVAIALSMEEKKRLYVDIHLQPLENLNYQA